MEENRYSPPMTLEEIKAAVLAGETVYCGNTGYTVVERNGEFYIGYARNETFVGLTRGGDDFFQAGGFRIICYKGGRFEAKDVRGNTELTKHVIRTLGFVLNDYKYHNQSLTGHEFANAILSVYDGYTPTIAAIVKHLRSL